MMEHPNTKYPMDLRKEIIRYFKTHTASQCAKKFKLSLNQVVGLLEVSRRRGILAPNYKDRRRHDAWTLEDWLFLVRRAGVRPRAHIAKSLGRGGARVIKERLRKDCGKTGTKWINGMPKKWADEIWGSSLLDQFKTDAGPASTRNDFHFIIIPWTECEIMCRAVRTDPTVKACVVAMSKFQKWVHGCKTNSQLKNKIGRILNER